jgi:hypothetical protein
MESEDAASGRSESTSGTEPAIKAAAERRLALLFGSYPGVFAAEGQAVARAAIEQAVARDWKLRHHPLANSDEAAGSFVPFRAADSEETG